MAAWVQCSADLTTRFDHFPSQPIDFKLQICTSMIPSKVRPHMACSLSQIPLGPHPYGHSYTAPTPKIKIKIKIKIYFLQQFGLACTKAFAIASHIRRLLRTRTQQAPQASSGPTWVPPGLNSPFSTDTGVSSRERERERERVLYFHLYNSNFWN